MLNIRRITALIILIIFLASATVNVFAETAATQQDGRTVTVTVGETEFTENRTMHAMDSVQPDMSMWPNAAMDYVDTDKDLWGNGLRGVNNTDAAYVSNDEYPYTLVANGLCSRIMVQFDDVIPRSIHQGDDLTDPMIRALRSMDIAGQYKLKDREGRSYYTYCVDVATDSNVQRVYNGQNVESASYYSEEDAKHIRFICLKGYWGTASGFGSLDSFTGMLVDEGILTSDEAAVLTPGEAMTATQAAIWKFGNSDNSFHVDDSIVTGYPLTTWKFNSVDWTWRDPYIANTGNRIKKIYNYLISGTIEYAADMTVLTKDNVLTDADIEVLERTSTGADSGYDTYKANVSFSMDIDVLATDDMTVTVVQEDVTLATVPLLPGTKDYTVENVVLKENTEVTLTLSGSRELGLGVYIFSAQDPTQDQTLVGVASGTQHVGLKKPLSFDVRYECEAVVSAEKKMLHGRLVKEQFTFQLYDAGGILIAEASNDDGGTVTFPAIGFTSDDLGGASEKVFTYTIKEIKGNYPGITYDESEKAVTITLKLTGDTLSAEVTYGDDPLFVNDQSVISVSVTKIWDDDDNKAGKRPSSVTVKLYEDGADTGRTIVLTKELEWTEMFTNLPMYAGDGHEIVYTVEEVPVNGYRSETVVTEEGFVITNTYIPPPDTFTDSRMEMLILMICACVMALSVTVRKIKRDMGER